MGQDKGSLVFHGETQVEHCWRLLTSHCVEAYVSVNSSRAGDAPYSRLPLILDDRDFEGPVSGLRAAWTRYPSVAWLVLAVDMPLVDRALLTELVAAREPEAFATAFERGGMIEPLCTIWEPQARDALQQAISAGNRSPRRLLESHSVTLMRASEPEKLTSVNSPEEYDAVRDRLRKADKTGMGF